MSDCDPISGKVAIGGTSSGMNDVALDFEVVATIGEVRLGVDSDDLVAGADEDVG